MSDSARIGKMVVAFDGSEDSVKAMRLANSLATKLGSELVVVHVYLSPNVAISAGSGMPVPDYSDLEDAAKESGQRVLAQGVQLAKEAGIKMRGELLEASSVVQAIVEFATNEKADLIVVGTRGMTGFRKLVVGSVSSGLVSHAPCAVLVVR